MRARTAELARSWRRTTPMRVSGDPADVESVTIRYLMYVLLPAWFVPGIADYWMHRQHIHSFLESLPIMAISALLCLHWDQVAGLGQDRAGAGARRLRLRLRRLPGGYLAGVLGGVAALIAGPYAEELWRCVKTSLG
jgi:hypothetical protein